MLRQIGKATYLMPVEEGMRVPGLIIATEKLLKEIEDSVRAHMASGLVTKESE